MPVMREFVLRQRRWCSRHWQVVSALSGILVFVALAYVVLKLAPQWFADTEGLTPQDRVTARQGVRTAALALLAGGLAVIGSFYTARTFALNRAGHLTDRFTTEYGVGPKALARVLRFERARWMLVQPTHPSLAMVAATCGYADQAHMTREWRALAGSSPKAWLAAEGLPFVQDPEPVDDGG